MGAAAAIFKSKLDAIKRTQPLVATASKSWIGHTEAAAGVMGLLHMHAGLAANTTQVRWHVLLTTVC
jgi:acyl transferase domain-containing protein